MSKFKLTEEHLKLLTLVVLQGYVSDGLLSPGRIELAKDLASNGFLNTKVRDGRWGIRTTFSPNAVGLSAIQIYGHNVLDNAIEVVVKKMK